MSDRAIPWRERSFGILLAALLAAILAAPAIAHQPGKSLDELMGNKEKYFQTIGKAAPDFTLRTADDRTVRLADFRGKVVVLFFIYTSCPDICPLHAERIAVIQDLIGQTPMKDRVRFIGVTTDPAKDTLEVLRDYGPARGLKPANWTFLTTTPGQAEDATRKLAKRFGHKFIKSDDGYQTHSVVTHVIDQEGRWAGNFFGLRFEPVNLVLYINGLTNTGTHSEEPAAPSLWEQVRKFF